MELSPAERIPEDVLRAHILPAAARAEKKIWQTRPPTILEEVLLRRYSLVCRSWRDAVRAILAGKLEYSSQHEAGLSNAERALKLRVTDSILATLSHSARSLGYRLEVDVTGAPEVSLSGVLAALDGVPAVSLAIRGVKTAPASDAVALEQLCLLTDKLDVKEYRTCNQLVLGATCNRLCVPLKQAFLSRDDDVACAVCDILACARCASTVHNEPNCPHMCDECRSSIRDAGNPPLVRCECDSHEHREGDNGLCTWCSINCDSCGAEFCYSCSDSGGMTGCTACDRSDAGHTLYCEDCAFDPNGELRRCAGDFADDEACDRLFCVAECSVGSETCSSAGCVAAICAPCAKCFREEYASFDGRYLCQAHFLAWMEEDRRESEEEEEEGEEGSDEESDEGEGESEGEDEEAE